MHILSHSHGLDQEEEDICLQSSFFVVVELSWVKQFTKDAVDCIHLRVVVKCIVDIGKVLGSDVLLVREEDLDLKYFCIYCWAQGRLVGKWEAYIAVRRGSLSFWGCAEQYHRTSSCSGMMVSRSISQFVIRACLQRSQWTRSCHFS